MAHTLSDLLVHAVFSTAERRPALGKSIQARLFGYMAGIVRARGGVAHIVGGAEDHVHLLLTVPASSSVADMLRFVKGNSSRWLNRQFPRTGKFAWQRGYAAFSVSRSRYRDVYSYIAGQEVHHRRISFQQELVAFLKKHQIEYDERYIWS